MLKTIAGVSPHLLAFILSLHLSLSRPQQRHVIQVVDALITSEGSKTLSGLYRNIVGDPCPKAAADTFREAPWEADAVRISLRGFLVQTAFDIAEAEGAPRAAFLSLDDSQTDKDNGSERLQLVDWFFDQAHSWPNHPAYTKANVYVLLRLTVGGASFTVDMAPYLRASTIRRLNKDRENGERLPFRTKIQIARAMLEAAAPMIPPDCQVYLLCDSWYAAASILKWCRAQDWHVICRLKSNRLLNGVQVRDHNQRLKHRRYDHVTVAAADEERPRTYLVRSLTGKLSSLPDQVRVYISKKHNGDKRPRYYCSTDPSLSAQAALNWFHHRWSCEVANWYIKERLGWADCRLWKVESAEKFLMVLWLALAYLEYRRARDHPRKSLADVIRLHRNEHARRLLEEACRMVLQVGNLADVLARFTLTPTV
jgi:hypothetical protein